SVLILRRVMAYGERHNIFLGARKAKLGENTSVNPGVVRGLNLRLLRFGVHAGAVALYIKREVPILSDWTYRGEITGKRVERSCIDIKISFDFSRAGRSGHVKNGGGLPAELRCETAFDDVEAINRRCNDDSPLAAGKRLRQRHA